MEKCPLNSLIKFIRTPGAKVPQDLLVHARSCKRCSEILSNPEQWDSFLGIYESLSEPSKNETTELKEGAVCRLKIKDSSSSVFALITDTYSLEKDGYVRVSPIAVSPHEDDVDETDIIIPPSQMPTGLPSLVEWWNDRPVLANSINRIFGNLDTDNYSIIKDKITNQPKISKSTRSVMMFREIERRKGNLMSASFFEKFL